MAKKSKKIKPGLGKGLEALLPSIEYREKGFKVRDEDGERKESRVSGTMASIDVNKIHHNPYQPRHDFDEKALEDLKNSIIEHGVIQPVTVRRDIRGYELISGERRLRATISAGFEKIPAYVLDIDSGVESLELALIENIQREDLNPIEVANGYQRLIEECNLKQEEVAAKVGKDRSTVTNFLRLLRLPEKIQDSLRRKETSMGHARSLLGLSSQKRMLLVWQEVQEAGLSVRQTEKLVKDIESGLLDIEENGKVRKKKKQPKADPKDKISAEIAAVLEETEDKLRHLFGTQVKINPKSEESGVIEMEFYSKDDLERILDMFEMIRTGR